MFSLWVWNGGMTIICQGYSFPYGTSFAIQQCCVMLIVRPPTDKFIPDSLCFVSVRPILHRHRVAMLWTEKVRIMMMEYIISRVTCCHSGPTEVTLLPPKACQQVEYPARVHSN
jgi:hypothetical protein